MEIEAPDLDDESPDPSPATAAEEEEEEEEEDGIRVSVNSWWCPEDDTSMPHSMKTCPKCGFIRP